MLKRLTLLLFLQMTVTVALIPTLASPSEKANNAGSHAQVAQTIPKAQITTERIYVTPEPKPPDDTPIWTGVIINGILALLTLFIAIFGYRQVRVSKDTAKRQLRAYLTVSSARLFLYPDGTVEPRIVFENSGQTPAYSFKGALALGVEQQCCRTDIPPPSNKSVVSYGSVGREYNLKGHKQNLPEIAAPRHEMTYEQFTSHFESGNGFLIVLQGWYTYADIFATTHPINFKLVIGDGMELSVDEKAGDRWLIFFDDSEWHSGHDKPK